MVDAEQGHKPDSHAIAFVPFEEAARDPLVVELIVTRIGESVFETFEER